MSNRGTHRQGVCMLSPQADEILVLWIRSGICLGLGLGDGSGTLSTGGFEAWSTRSMSQQRRIGGRDGARAIPSGHQSGRKIVASMNVLAAPRRKTRSSTNS